ncbi:MAG: SurA N-terminal domain-containing protein [Deltaproteobacteria bacterium]|nr:SurA N-terminal domain-containing protein [Deltaproteobacteria bacterium]MBW2050642.1 SurA N-terminal domain-containing protein [Deltaproteobacteria bacterium]MBW2139464.1 SurA N-terminal domain-containing protein [Deltaproteobacteria bacterium]MBW2322213.1 SurA N-terminal domain-containing protein [Deltaproteobacteria bacterium]
MRKALTIGVLGISLAIGFFSIAVKAEVVDRIVAVVNGDIITMQEIDGRLKTILKRQPTEDKVRINQIRRQILELLIERNLIAQENKKLGITVSNEEVDQAIERIKKRNSFTQEEFEANLNRMGMNMDLVKTDLRGQLNKMKLLNKEMRPRIIISDDQIDAYYKAHAQDYDQEDKVHLRNILLILPMNASESIIREKMNRANEIIAEINNGRNFADAAQEYSKGTNASTGGDMGLVAWDDMTPVIRDALKDLKDGQMCQPIKLGQTIQILQVVSRYGSNEKAVAATKKRIQEMLISQELKKKYNAWLKATRTKSMIKIKF